MSVANATFDLVEMDRLIKVEFFVVIVKYDGKKETKKRKEKAGAFLYMLMLKRKMTIMTISMLHKSVVVCCIC
jgi:hypothetical protein